MFLVNFFQAYSDYHREHRKNSAEAQGTLSPGLDAKLLEAVGEIKGINSDVSRGADDDTSLGSLSPEKEAPVPQLISGPSDEQLKSLEKKVNAKDAIIKRLHNKLCKTKRKVRTLEKRGTKSVEDFMEVETRRTEIELKVQIFEAG